MAEGTRKWKSKKHLTARHGYRKWEDWAAGDIVIGEIVDFQNDSYDHKCMVLKVEETFWQNKKAGKEQIGKRLFINSNGMILKRIEELEVGNVVQIEYQGTNTIEKGKYKGKEAHQVDLQLMEEDNGDDSGDDNEETEEDDL